MCGVQAAYTLYLLWSRPYIVPSYNVLAPAIAAATTAGFALAAAGESHAAEALALAATFLAYAQSGLCIGGFALDLLAVALTRLSTQPMDDGDSGNVNTESFCALKFDALPPVSVELLPVAHRSSDADPVFLPPLEGAAEAAAVCAASRVAPTAASALGGDVSDSSDLPRR